MVWPLEWQLFTFWHNRLSVKLNSMNIEKKIDYTHIKVDEKTFSEFYSAYKKMETQLSAEHIIIEFSDNLNSTNEEISLFLNVSKLHQKQKTSFVIVSSSADIDEFPEDFNIVPTLGEAEDVLEMEAIERDLGF